ncbi:MAG: NusG domain II-containing protein [Rhodothermia bacterium]|nr:NusG domain II-containing protein [Rhodothermia bacterium]
MNRREWLKILAGGTAAVAAGTTATTLPWLANSSDTVAYYAVTPNPSRTAGLILAATNTPASSITIGARQIAPSATDITIVRNGVVVDPTSSEAPAALGQLAHELRGYRMPATHLVSLEPAHESRRRDPDRVVFEVDGRIVESIDRNGEYNRITIAGAAGDTVFSLRKGDLRVVSSSCRHKLCMRCGTVRSGRIICAPNRLLASVGDGYPAGLDTITG